MNLKEFKTKLNDSNDNINDSMTVCIEGCGTRFSLPFEVEVNQINIEEGNYISEDGKVLHKKFLHIGSVVDY